MNADQFDRIDHYLRGELSSSEAKEFEASLAGDPALSEEVDTQKDIVDGIRHYRKQQLKQQLAQVNLPESTGWQAVGVKALVGVAVTSVAILGIGFFSADVEEKVAEPIMVKMEGPTYEKTQVVLPEINVPEEVQYTPSTVVVAKRIEAPKADVAETPRTTEEFNAAVLLPDDETSTTDIDFVPEQVTEEFNASSIEPSEKVLQVDNYDTESLDLKYEYFDGKLALYGNFGDAPYQILEINHHGEKRLFLFHEEAYYAIGNTSSPLPLKQIDDAEIVAELEIFRNEK